MPALLVLAAGAMLIGASTVPSYFLLASGRERRILGVAIGAALLNAVLAVFIAARDPQPETVARAMFVGHGLFAIAIATLAIRTWLRDAASRWRLIAQSFMPAVLAIAAVWLALEAFRALDPLSTLGRTVVFTAGYAPFFWWFGRGVGLSTLLREWLAARRG